MSDPDSDSKKGEETRDMQNEAELEGEIVFNMETAGLDENPSVE